MHDFYKTAILEAVNACEDINLLDLVWKMLQESAKIPDPVEPLRMEVRTDADHSRDTRLHRAVSIQICGSATHSGQVYPKVGNRRAELSRVCSGADSLPSAA
jgi:hypothetical protein